MSPDPIGIFDSGSGGLSIWQAVRRELPYESIVYVGDHGHMPYGGKDTAYIQKRGKNIISFLQKKRVKLVIVACNTSTVAGIDIYRNVFPGLPIVGVVPVVKSAAHLTVTKEMLVMSTEYTAKSSYQKELIDSYAAGNKVHSLGCPGLVEKIEQGASTSPSTKALLVTLLAPYLKTPIDHIVLGCTHFAFVKDVLRDIVGDAITLLDSGGAVGRQTRRILTNNALLSEAHPRHVFYTTGIPMKVEPVMRSLIHEPITVHYEHI
jgi:glutamate racemase